MKIYWQARFFYKSRILYYASFKKGINKEMNEVQKKVAVLALKRLLVELKDHRPDICVRYRLLGQMWAKNFLRVVQVTELGVVLNDEATNRLVNIPDLSHIMQFELDKAFQSFQPYIHYDVVTTGEW